MLTMFIKGLIIGIVVSAPVGPIGVLCIQRTLTGGRRAGIATALGAASSDLFYAIIAVFGMSFVVDYIESNQTLLQVLGTIVIFFFGLHTFRNDPRQKLKKFEKDEQQTGFVSSFFSAMGLTVTNPLVVFLFIFLFAKLHYISDDITLCKSLLSIVFIMFGAGFWWTLMIYAIDQFRTRFFNVRQLYVVNRVAGALLMIIAPISLIIFFSGISPWH